LPQCEKELAAYIKAQPRDDLVRFQLGTVQFLRAVEKLSGSFYRYGLLSDLRAPFLRLPVPRNANPETVTYEKARAILSEFVEDLAVAEATLSQVRRDDVKLTVPFGMIRLDLNGDGQATEKETLWRVYARLSPLVTDQANAEQQNPDEIEKQAKQFVIAFDAGDVHWLRGYCHLLMAVGEFWLAHDGRELFARTAHLFFPKAEVPYEFLKHNAGRAAGEEGELPTWQIIDAVAAIHLIRLEPSEPERLKRAREHLKAMIDQSRQSWKRITAETDNDHEWIPNPQQETVIGVKVTEEMIEDWQQILDELDQILDGKKLLPFWRDRELGINLRRVFEEPRTFDLVLWVQGTAALPYLEKGTISQPETWQELQQSFGAQFVGFAIWFN
jgi:hypothetical protein